MRSFKRFLILALAIVLLCGAVLPAHAYGLFGGGKKPKPGERVEISANDRSAEGLVFDHWEANVPGVVFDDPKAPVTWFIMPQGVQSINIEAKYVKPKPVLMNVHPMNLSGERESVVLGNFAMKRSEVRAIEFVNSLDGAGTDAWDVSEAGDGSALAWTKEEGSGKKLYIGGQGGVTAPEDVNLMFFEYINLESINFNDCFFTEKTTSMNGMFFGCSNLTSLDVSGFDTQNVTDMHGMFADCSNLTSLNVSGIDTRNVTDMGSMFSGCSSLTSLDVSGFDTRNVTDMGYMFYNCSSLSWLNVSGFDTRNVTDMQFMFFGCNKLTGVDLSRFQ